MSDVISHIQSELEAISHERHGKRPASLKKQRIEALLSTIRSEENFLESLTTEYIRAAEFYVWVMRDIDVSSAKEAGERFLKELATVKVNYAPLLCAVASCLITLGSMDKALDRLNRAYVMASKFDIDAQIARVHGLQAVLYREIREPQKAIDSYKQALRLLSKTIEVDPFPVIMTYSNLVNAYSDLAAYDLAISSGEQCLALYEKCKQYRDRNPHKGMTDALGYVHNNLAKAWLAKNDVVRAKTFYTEGLKLNESSSNELGQLYALRGLGGVALHEDDWEKGISYLEKALILAEKLTIPQEVVACYEALAEAHQKADNDTEALRYYQQFHESYRDLFDKERQKRVDQLEVKHRTEVAELRSNKLTHENELLAEAYAQQDEILKIVAHDLRNPLHATVMRLGLASQHFDRGDTTKGAKSIAQAQQSLSYMSKIVEQLKTMALYDSEPVSVNWEDVSLNTLLKSGIERNKPQAEQKGIFVEFIERDDVQMRGDAQKLRQMFDNLLANSIKYSNPGATVWVRLELDAEWVRVRFVDEGVGIAPAEVVHLFTRFGRLPSSRPTKNEDSLGLGLYISQKQAEAMGGTISADSAGLNQGSTFTVELPIVHSKLTSQPEATLA